MPVTPEQARALAPIVAACRAHGATAWDEPGIMAALKAVSHIALADVALAAIRAADDRTAKTPAVITNLRSPHWRERATDRPQPREPYDERAFCGVCSKPNDRHPEDHAFVAMDHLRARHANADPDVVADAKTQLRRTLAGGAS